MGLFDEQIARKPNHYPWTQDFINAMWEGFWTPQEFSFKSDLHDFKTELTEQEKGVIVRTLSAIGQIEIAVKKFWAKLGDNLPHPSITDMGLVMANVEVIHNNAYERLLNVLGLDDIFQQNLEEQVIKGRVLYLKKYLDRVYKDTRKQYIYALILFTLFVENVSLFSQFYIILWFGRYRNLLKDTNQQVLYTKNEENLHAKIGIQLINTLRLEYPELFDQALENQIIAEVHEALRCEREVIKWIMRGYSGERISEDIITEYVKYRLNKSLNAIKYNQQFVLNNSLYRDFEWMNEEELANSHVDFFFKRSVNYSRGNRVLEEAELF